MWASYLSNEELLDVLKEYLIKNKYTADIEREILSRYKKLEAARYEEAHNEGYQYGYEDGKANCGCDYRCDENCPNKPKLTKLENFIRQLNDIV